MTLTLKIKLDNAAFEDGPELARILKELAKSMADEYPPIRRDHALYDINGNHVGACVVRGRRAR